MNAYNQFLNSMARTKQTARNLLPRKSPGNNWQPRRLPESQLLLSQVSRSLTSSNQEQLPSVKSENIRKA